MHATRDTAGTKPMLGPAAGWVTSSWKYGGDCRGLFGSEEYLVKNIYPTLLPPKGIFSSHPRFESRTFSVEYYYRSTGWPTELLLARS
jgi:hypothetical protein